MLRQAVKVAMPVLQKLGFGGVMGACAAYAAKIVGRAAASARRDPHESREVSDRSRVATGVLRRGLVHRAPAAVVSVGIPRCQAGRWQSQADAVYPGASLHTFRPISRPFYTHFWAVCENLEAVSGI